MNEIILYSTSDLCKILGVNRAKIEQYREAGLLNGRRFGRGWYFTTNEVSQFLERTSGLDLSNPDKIKLAGASLRNAIRVSNHE